MTSLNWLSKHRDLLIKVSKEDKYLSDPSIYNYLERKIFGGDVTATKAILLKEDIKTSTFENNEKNTINNIISGMFNSSIPLMRGGDIKTFVENKTIFDLWKKDHVDGLKQIGGYIQRLIPPIYERGSRPPYIDLGHSNYSAKVPVARIPVAPRFPMLANVPGVVFDPNTVRGPLIHPPYYLRGALPFIQRKSYLTQYVGEIKNCVNRVGQGSDLMTKIMKYYNDILFEKGIIDATQRKEIEEKYNVSDNKAREVYTQIDKVTKEVNEGAINKTTADTEFVNILNKCKVKYPFYADRTHNFFNYLKHIQTLNVMQRINPIRMYPRRRVY
jgi:hypothetical protein